MLRRRSPGPSLDDLVENMFCDVFNEDERRDLQERIAAWEAANPDRPAAERVTAWIDIAYALQSGRVPVVDMSAPRIIGQAVHLRFP